MIVGAFFFTDYLGLYLSPSELFKRELLVRCYQFINKMLYKGDWTGRNIICFLPVSEQFQVWALPVTKRDTALERIYVYIQNTLICVFNMYSAICRLSISKAELGSNQSLLFPHHISNEKASTQIDINLQCSKCNILTQATSLLFLPLTDTLPLIRGGIGMNHLLPPSASPFRTFLFLW